MGKLIRLGASVRRGKSPPDNFVTTALMGHCRPTIFLVGNVETLENR
jgi:hypothetical protein